MSSEVSEQKLEEKKVDVKFKSTVYCMLNRISLRSTPNKKYVHFRPRSRLVFGFSRDFGKTGNGRRERFFFGIPGSRKSRFKYKSIIIFMILRRQTNPILRKTVKFYISFCFGHKNNQFLTENEFEIENFHHFSEKKSLFPIQKR